MSDSDLHRTLLHSFNISGDNPSGPGVLLTLSLCFTRCLVIVASSTLGPWNKLSGFGDGWLTSSLTNTPCEGFIYCLGSLCVICPEVVLNVVMVPLAVVLEQTYAQKCSWLLTESSATCLSYLYFADLTFLVALVYCSRCVSLFLILYFCHAFCFFLVNVCNLLFIHLGHFRLG